MLSLLSDPVTLILYLASLLVAIAVHEASHAFVADKLGDPTPRIQGRITLNPLKHVDPMGIIMLFVVGFGWGKPVEFDPYNLKHPRRDAALISFAGPISNLLLATLLGFLIPLTHSPFLYPVLYMNVVLAVFNLVPVHPLDGFKIVGGLLPGQTARDWYGLARYGIFFLLLLILPIGSHGNMLSSIIGPPISFILRLLTGSVFSTGSL